MMKLDLGWKWILAACLAFTLSHCTSKPAEEKKPPTPTLDPVDPSTAKGHAAGKHCFHAKESNMSIDGMLELREGNTVDGHLKGIIVQEGSEDAMWDASFNGRLVGDSLHLNVLSNETGTKAETKEVWVWTSDKLQVGSHAMAANPCAQ